MARPAATSTTGNAAKPSKPSDQVNGIGCADDGQVGQYQEADYTKRQGNLFEEGNNQDIVGGICRKVEQCQTSDDGNAGLPHHFKFGRHAVRVFINHFAPVVVKTECAGSEQDA